MGVAAVKDCLKHLAVDERAASLGAAALAAQIVLDQEMLHMDCGAIDAVRLRTDASMEHFWQPLRWYRPPSGLRTPLRARCRFDPTPLSPTAALTVVETITRHRPVSPAQPGVASPRLCRHAPGSPVQRGIGRQPPYQPGTCVCLIGASVDARACAWRSDAAHARQTRERRSDGRKA